MFSINKYCRNFKRGIPLSKVGKLSMFSINKYCQNFKPGIPLSKDFRNEAIQMAATRLISEIRERYRIYPSF